MELNSNNTENLLIPYASNNPCYSLEHFIIKINFIMSTVSEENPESIE